MLVSDPTGFTMSALGGGTLEMVDGCLGASGSVIVWPPGTKLLDDDPVRIRIPRLGTYAIGDTVRLGGGNVHEPPEDPTDGPVIVGTVHVPTSCAAHTIFLAGPTDL